MAAFRQHVTFSSVLGVGYAASLTYAGMEWTHSVLAGGLCGVAGMLPDLDSDSGKPVRELFGLAAAIAPLLLMRRLERITESPEGAILLAALLYVLIRFGASWLFKMLTVHRGMFHSLPAALIAGELAFLAHDCPEPNGRLILAGGVLVGFLSHLVLDELSSVDAAGLRLNKSAGSAMKLFSRSWTATLLTWILLAGLSYAVVADQPAVVTKVRGMIEKVVANIQGTRSTSLKPESSGRDATAAHIHPR